ncbi:hypothetical protein [Bradyrhizobium sp. AZCC 2289]|uniref:hypothetical protein n=1 Tax=Bradyrhizobium sp. AZCC 2289 TaxID=3117026 RepID=UPI002FF43727
MIKQRLRGDPFDTIAASFAAHAHKSNKPGFRISGCKFGVCCSQPAYPRHDRPLIQSFLLFSNHLSREVSVQPLNKAQIEAGGLHRMSGASGA